VYPVGHRVGEVGHWVATGVIVGANWAVRPFPDKATSSDAPKTPSSAVAKAAQEPRHPIATMAIQKRIRTYLTAASPMVEIPSPAWSGSTIVSPIRGPRTDLPADPASIPYRPPFPQNQQLFPKSPRGQSQRWTKPGRFNPNGGSECPEADQFRRRLHNPSTSAIPYKLGARPTRNLAAESAPKA
jgi:hypothetical protein